MLRAHRQAWAWQDEYHGLTLEDIRALERETQLALAEKMAAAAAAAAGEGGERATTATPTTTIVTTDHAGDVDAMDDDAFGSLSSEPFPSSPASSSSSSNRYRQDHQRLQQHGQVKSSVHFSDSVTSGGGEPGSGVAPPPCDLHRSTSQESTASTVVNGGAAVSGGVGGVTSRGASSSSLSSLSQQRRSSRSRSSPVGEWGEEGPEGRRDKGRKMH